MITVNNSEFRCRLQKIASQPIQHPDDHKREIEKLRTEYPHSIQWLSEELYVLRAQGSTTSAVTGDYDCFTFAFDLVGSQARLAVLNFAPVTTRFGQRSSTRPGIQGVLPGNDFVEFLNLEECAGIQGSSLVMYFCDGKAVHAGKVHSGARVISKWGKKGYLWDHGVWEVPSSYGEPRFFIAPPKEEFQAKFVDYLTQLDVPEDYPYSNKFRTLVRVIKRSWGDGERQKTAKQLLDEAAMMA